MIDMVGKSHGSPSCYWHLGFFFFFFLQLCKIEVLGKYYSLLTCHQSKRVSKFCTYFLKLKQSNWYWKCHHMHIFFVSQLFWYQSVYWRIRPMLQSKLGNVRFVRKQKVLKREKTQKLIIPDNFKNLQS